VGRIRPGTVTEEGGTGWIIADGRIVSAGHVFKNPGYVDVIEFKVDPSSSAGTITLSDPEDQYMIDDESIIKHDDGEYNFGDDWAVFEVFANPNTGLMPKEAQCAYYNVKQDVNAVNLRVTGYGIDNELTKNRTLQTDTGLNNGSSNNILYYRVDTQPGNSGSPVIDVATGYAIGVHTDPGCNVGGGANVGTSFLNTFFWSEMPIEITVDQLDEDGGRLDKTTVGIWGTNDFINFPIPKKFIFYDGDHATFRGKQNLENDPSEKYHRWNEFQDVTNHQTFEIDGSFTRLVSNFKKTYGGITIKSQLIYGNEGNNDIIEFKDPWFIDYADPNYGGNLRNRGMKSTGLDALRFWERSSPFYPNYNTIYGNNPYYGVFLDRPFTGNNSYYSIHVPQEQTFQAHTEDVTGYFLNWEANPSSAASFQNANNLTTPVVFHQDNTTVMALYKGHLASENSMATGYNNARRVVRDGSGTYHMVYEDNNEIWYTSSSNGSTWSAEVRISYAIDEEEGYHSPAIAIDADPTGQKIVVVWEAQNEEGLSGVEHYVCYRQKYQGAWSDIEYFPEDPVFESYYTSLETIYPVVYAEGVGYVIVTWKVRSVYDEQDRVFIRLKTQGEWTDIAEVPDVEGHPALTRKLSGESKTKLAWSDGSNIHLISGDFTGEEWEWDEVVDITNSSPAYYVNDQPSVDVDENNYLHITWQKRELTALQREYVAHKDDQYNYQTEFIKTGYTLHSPLVTSNASNGNIRLAYHATTTYGLSSVRTIESPHTQYFWSPENVIAYDSRYPSFVPRSPVSFLAYTKYNGAPYFVKTAQPYSQKLMSSNIAKYNRSKEVKFENIPFNANESVSGFINFEVDLGIEELKKAKSSYHPDKTLAKYRVSLK